MTLRERTEVVSSYTIIKGPLIEETYAAFCAWDFQLDNATNWAAIVRDNRVNARSASWLRDVSGTIRRRYQPNGYDRPLVELAKANCDLAIWKPLMLWHMTRDEFLVRDFFLNWLYPAKEQGIYRVMDSDLYPYLKNLHTQGRTTKPWTENTTGRTASMLLKIAVSMGLMTGTVGREFIPYHLPEESFLYLVYALREQTGANRELVDSEEWRLFLMRPEQVESELMRLHQYRKLQYHAAGSIVELSLPCDSLLAYARTLIHV